MARAPDPLTQLSRSLLPGVPPTQANELLERMTRMELPAGTRLITQDEPSDALYFVHIGGLEVTTSDGEESLHLAFIGPDHWVGEVSVIDRGRASANVTAAAATPTVVYRLDADALIELRDAAPQVAASLLRTLSLDMVRRIRSSTEYLLERLGVATGPEPEPEHRTSWFTDALTRIFRGEAAR